MSNRKKTKTALEDATISHFKNSNSTGMTITFRSDAKSILQKNDNTQRITLLPTLIRWKCLSALQLSTLISLAKPASKHRRESPGPSHMNYEGKKFILQELHLSLYLCFALVGCHVLSWTVWRRLKFSHGENYEWQEFTWFFWTLCWGLSFTECEFVNYDRRWRRLLSVVYDLRISLRRRAMSFGNKEDRLE